MGNDGGVLQKGRQFMVKQKGSGSSGPKKDSVEARAARMANCALTSEALKSPVVADELGNLFNKEALIAYLLDKARVIPAFSHIRKLKDVTAVRATVNPSAGSSTGPSAPFICPLTQAPANGAQPFVVVRGCGCMLSERAVKELSSGGDGTFCCPACGKSADPAPTSVLGAVIKLCPTEEEETALRQRLVAKLSAPTNGSSNSGASNSAATGSKPLGDPSGHSSLSSSSSSSSAAAVGANSSVAGSKRPREEPTSSSAVDDDAPHRSRKEAAQQRISTGNHSSSSGSGKLPSASSSSAAASRGAAHIAESVHAAFATSATNEAEKALAARKQSSSVFATLFSGTHGKMQNSLNASGLGAALKATGALPSGSASSSTATTSAAQGSAAHADFRTRTGAHRW